MPQSRPRFALSASNRFSSLRAPRSNGSPPCKTNENELVNKRYVYTVLTTNFDQLVLQGIIRTGIMPVTADGLEALNRITGKPKRPQVIHLHGSMHTYNLRNSRVALSETSSDRGALSMIHSLLQQCDLLVVVGYGAASLPLIRSGRRAS